MSEQGLTTEVAFGIMSTVKCPRDEFTSGSVAETHGGSDMEDSTTKRCSRCKQFKPLSAFFKNRTTKDGLRFECKECMALYLRNYRETHWPELLAQDRKYYKTHRHKAAAKNWKYRTKYPERARAYNRLQKAVRRGQLKKPLICERCGKQTEKRRLHGHHPDYSKPLSVEWLCAQCHKTFTKEAEDGNVGGHPEGAGIYRAQTSRNGLGGQSNGQ